MTEKIVLHSLPRQKDLFYSIEFTIPEVNREVEIL